jgi:hypothetical protein
MVDQLSPKRSPAPCPNKGCDRMKIIKLNAHALTKPAGERMEIPSRKHHALTFPARMEISKLNAQICHALTSAQCISAWVRAL